MDITIVANGFQKDYILNLVNSLAKHSANLEFIGSAIYDPVLLDKSIRFLKLSGNHNENASLLRKSTRITVYYFRLCKYLLNSKKRLIHFQWYRFYLIEGIFMSILTRITGKKLVYTAHNVLPHNRDNIVIRFIFRIIYLLQNQIFVHTEYLRKRLINEFNIHPAKIHTIRHGVYKVIDNKDITCETAREKYRYNRNDFILLFFGKISKYKGLDLLLKAFNGLSPGNDIKLVIAGKADKDYQDEFNTLINMYNSENITLLTGYIEDWEVEYLFKLSDVTVLPYKESSQSGVMYMSYAYGIPVIAPRMGGFTDDVYEGKTGLLYEPGDVASLKSAILRIRETFYNTDIDPHSGIKEFIAYEYSWNKIAERMIQIYNNQEIKI